MLTKILTLILMIYCFQYKAYGQQSDSLSSYWSGNISSGGFFQNGNTNKIYAEGDFEIKRADKIIETILNTYVGYGEKNQLKDEQILSGVFTADFFYQKTISLFLLQNAEYNFSKGIDLHTQSGAGVKYVFFHKEKSKSSVSLALIYDFVNLKNNPTGFDSKNTRFSLRFKTRNAILPHLIFSAVGFYQPAVNDFANTNIRIDAALEVPLIKNFYFDAAYQYSKKDVVSVGRKRADSKFTYGIGYNF